MAEELRELFETFNDALNRVQTTYTYRINDDGSGDLVLVDNLATAHRASPDSHIDLHGLRILHRTTMEGTAELDPPAFSGLPPFSYIWGENPLGQGVWQGSDHWGVGFRWNHSIPMYN